MVEFEILEKKINDFLYNDKLINAVKNVQATRVTIDKYRELVEHWNRNINDFKQLKQLLEMLSKENELNEEMVSCFQNAVCDINNEFYDDIDIKNYCSGILSKVSIDKCWNEYSYIHIEINVERILKKENKSK